MLTAIEKLTFLRTVPTFAGCELESLRRVADTFVVQHFDAGEVVLRQGEPGRALYVVAEGRIGIAVAGREVAELGPREVFGEMALFDGGPRSASATVREAATLLRLDRGDFYRLGRESPDLLIGVINVLSVRLRVMTARGHATAATLDDGDQGEEGSVPPAP